MFIFQIPVLLGAYWSLYNDFERMKHRGTDYVGIEE